MPRRAESKIDLAGGLLGRVPDFLRGYDHAVDVMLCGTRVLALVINADMQDQE